MIENIIQQEAARGVFSGAITIKQGASFEGAMHNFDNPRIEIQVDPDYEQRTQKLVKRFPDRLELLTRALVRHEINHHKYGKLTGSPITFDNYVPILEAIAEEMIVLGLPNVPVGQGHTLYTYMANLFEDFIDNGQLGTTMDMTGFWLLYKDDIKEKRFGAMFDAFIRMQEAVYGTRVSKKLMRSTHAKDERVAKVVQEFLDESGTTQNTYDVLNNTKRWSDVARLFTQKIAPLIDKNQLNNTIYLQTVFRKLETDGFPQEIKDEDKQMAIIWKKYTKGKENKDETFTPPAFLDNYLSLKLLYQRMARNMEIRTRHSTNADMMPVTRYGSRKFQPLDDRLTDTKVSFRGGQFGLYVEPYAVEIPIAYEERPHTLPEIRVCFLDTSDSTRNNVGAKERPMILNPWADEEKQWSDDSVYHYELLAWFGLVAFLKKQGASKKTSAKLANFSSQTRYADNLDDAYRIALSPQFGSTYFDIDTMFHGARKALLFSLSDGGVANWDSVKDDFIKRAKQNYYFHIQIGTFTRNSSGEITNKPQMCTDLEQAGLPVFYDDGRNVSKMMIDLTRPFVTKGQGTPLRYTMQP